MSDGRIPNLTQFFAAPAEPKWRREFPTCVVQAIDQMVRALEGFPYPDFDPAAMVFMIERAVDDAGHVWYEGKAKIDPREDVRAACESSDLAYDVVLRFLEASSAPGSLAVVVIMPDRSGYVVRVDWPNDAGVAPPVMAPSND